jgi:DNA-binding NarL/FixJ family response regulator
MKVLLVDDHLMVIEALGQLLAQRLPYVKISTAIDENAALGFLKLNRDCGAVVSDLSFRGKMEGYHLVKEITERHPQLPVVVLSMHAEAAFVRKAFAEGALGYVLKTDSPEEICRAIEAVVKGEKFLSSALNEKDVFGGSVAPHELSAREQEIAQLVRAGASSKAIGEKLKISPRTVEVHRRNIMKKLNVHNTAQLVAMLGG